MYAGFLSLTGKEVDSGSQIVDLGQVRFELSVIKVLATDTWYQVRVSGGDRVTVDHKPGGPKGRSLRFCVAEKGLGAIYNLMATVLSSEQVLHPPVVAVPTVDATGKADHPVVFDMALLQNLPGNVHLYSMTWTPDASVLAGPVNFQLTSTDCESIFYLVDGMLHSNPPNLQY